MNPAPDPSSNTFEDDLCELVEGTAPLDTPAARAVLERAGITLGEAHSLRRVRRELAEIAAFEAEVEREALAELQRSRGAALAAPAARAGAPPLRPVAPRLRPWLLAAAAVLVSVPVVSGLWGRRAEPAPAGTGDASRVLMGGALRVEPPAGPVAADTVWRFTVPDDLAPGDRVVLVVEDPASGALRELDVTDRGGAAQLDAGILSALGAQFEVWVEVRPRGGGSARRSNVVTAERSVGR